MTLTPTHPAPTAHSCVETAVTDTAEPSTTEPSTAEPSTAETSTDYEDVCALEDLVPERAAAALVAGAQVALVRLLDDSVYALGQHDPFSDANVMSRGIVGSATVDGVDVPTLQSPMYKQPFDVRTGRCLVDDEVSLQTRGVRVRDGRVLVARRPAGTPTQAGA